MSEHAPLPWILFDNLPEPVLVLDANRVVVSANRAAKTLLGTVVEDADLALALRQPAALAAADAALSGITSEPTEIKFGGVAEQIFEVRAVPLDDNGAISAVLTLHDTTRERRAQGMRSDFVANVSHELRSPLAAVLGFVETLRGPAKDDADARERFLGIMQGEAERMTRLIDDLLSLSKVEADEHIQPQDPIAIGPLLARVVDVVRARADERGVEIEVHVPGNVPNVIGDADQLTQVFQNLIENAVKYGGEESVVRVTASVRDTAPGGIAVVITDQGDGIPASDLPRLTERFYRVDKARSREMGGTGLGLAIVKHIIGRHRGRLEIDSEEGVGSTFAVLLPTSTS